MDKKCIEMLNGYVCYDEDHGWVTLYDQGDQELVVFEFGELESLISGLQEAYEALKKVAGQLNKNTSES